jgi:hypothetical protein
MARLLAVLALVLLPAGPAQGAEWGGIEPGVATTDTVRARYGAATRETRATVEGYDTVQWVYEGDRAPSGLLRMTVDFGLLTPAGYRPSTVRLLKLEPRPLIFGRQTVMQGWGLPDGVGSSEGVVTFFYKSGLFVVFDGSGQSAASMIFSIPQPDPGAPAAPPSAPSKP